MKSRMWKKGVVTVVALTMMIWQAQAAKYTLSGYVDDAGTGEKLIGATVFDQASLQGTTSNLYGFFSVTLPEGQYEIVASFVGYQRQVITIDLTKDQTFNFSLQSALDLEEVEIVGTQSEAIQDRSQMSVISLPMQDLQNLPALFGERDVMKALQLMPGVQSGGEGTSGLYVRGGGPDQNLILLDGVPVYNATHLFGFFSVFNTDALNSVELIKGGFPAHYGGRLSSVIDIRMKEGNTKKLRGAGSVGLISSKLTLEGPLIKDRSSFIVSGRRTYIDLLAQPFIRAIGNAEGAKVRAGYYFYDLNGKVNYKFSESSRLFLSTYLGNDNAYARIEESYIQNNVRFTSKDNSGLGWGNITTALRWNKILNQRLFANTTLTYSRYRFQVGADYSLDADPGGQTEALEYSYSSGINDLAGKVDFDFIPNPNHYIKFGVGHIYHTFNPGVNVFQQDIVTDASVDTTFGNNKIYAHEFSTYIEDDMKIGGRMKVNAGLHFSGFRVRGENYFSLQPRISGRYLLSEDWSLKGSYATMRQFIHLLTNSTVGLPTDLWLPATDRVPPQKSQQLALGVAHTFKEKYEVSVEGYYKTMDNLIEYKEGASFFLGGEGWEDQVEVGKGTSYGAELFIQKKTGRLHGWIGYTLSWTNRQFENLNFGNEFPYKYDRRHDLSVALTYKFSDRIDAGVTWVYGTGNAISLATDRYQGNARGVQDYIFNGSEVQYFEERNDYRMASFHRLDASVNFHKEKKWGKRTWTLGVYNIYNRQNPFYLYYDTDFNGNRQLKQVSLFPVIPSVSYSFSF